MKGKAGDVVHVDVEVDVGDEADDDAVCIM